MFLETLHLEPFQILPYMSLLLAVAKMILTVSISSLILSYELLNLRGVMETPWIYSQLVRNEGVSGTPKLAADIWSEHSLVEDCTLTLELLPTSSTYLNESHMTRGRVNYLCVRIPNGTLCSAPSNWNSTIRKMKVKTTYYQRSLLKFKCICDW